MFNFILGVSWVIFLGLAALILADIGVAFVMVGALVMSFVTYHSIVEGV